MKLKTLSKVINFERTKNIFIDFDGVIVDSNEMKEVCIQESIYKVCGCNQKSHSAINFFNRNAGIPRKNKLLKFFNQAETFEIMKLYGNKCSEEYSNLKPIHGTDQFLDSIKQKYKSIKIFILSGGEKDEILEFIKQNKINTFFEDVLASNKLKSEHLIDLKASKNDFFIGDSQKDFEMALKHPIKFILINGNKSILSTPSINDLKKIDLISYDLLSLTNFI